MSKEDISTVVILVDEYCGISYATFETDLSHFHDRYTYDNNEISEYFVDGIGNFTFERLNYFPVDFVKSRPCVVIHCYC